MCSGPIDFNIDRNRKCKEIGIGSCFISLWIFFPVISLFLMCFSLYFNSYFLRHKKFLYSFISLTFAIIAYTQISISGTDIERYYGMFSFCVTSLQNIDFSVLFIDNLYYIFNPVSAFIVSLFHNVQFFSLFWIFVVYYFYFLCCENYSKYRNIELTRREFLLFIFVSLFGIILFTQITEIVKQAVATSIFFYAFTLYLLGKKAKCIFWLLISIGIHSTPLFLLPLFFYNYFNKVSVLIIGVISILLSFNNIMELIALLLPNSGMFLLLHEKAVMYTDEMSDMASSLLRYDLLMFIYLFLVLSLRILSYSKLPSKVFFVFMIYFCLLLSNRHMVHNYIRFVNMSFVVYGFLFLELLHSVFTQNISKFYIKVGVVVAFLGSFVHMTYYRTIGGSYLSSYMDNSLIKICLSSVFDYFSFVAY